VSSAVRVEETEFDGAPALELVAGPLRAVVLPDVGMTGVSLRRGDDEFLALPDGVSGLQAGRTGGLPLLAPWANRLSSLRFTAADVDVDLTGLGVRTDDNGLPILGLLFGAPGWRVVRTGGAYGVAWFDASIHVDSPAFPFPHRLSLAMQLTDDRLSVATTVAPTGTRPVPVSVGWHPYLRLPGGPRAQWTLRLPDCEHLELDALGIPSGRSTAQHATSAPIADRTFDDLFALGNERNLMLGSEAGSIELRCGDGYDFAQVWVPADRPFAALEPMVAATDALVAGTVPLVDPGDRFTARFSLVIS
jgi:galactose mutarotase-like enzyme